MSELYALAVWAMSPAGGPPPLAYIIAALSPLIALAVCVGWSLHSHFDAATWTHCRVPNVLPSLRFGATFIFIFASPRVREAPVTLLVAHLNSFKT